MLIEAIDLDLREKLRDSISDTTVQEAGMYAERKRLLKAKELHIPSTNKHNTT